MKRAYRAVEHGDLDSAAESGALLIDHAPSHPAALNLMGLVRLRQGNGDEAAVLFRRATKSAPNDPAIHRNLGHAFKQADRPTEAVAALRVGLEISLVLLAWMWIARRREPQSARVPSDPPVRGLDGLI